MNAERARGNSNMGIVTCELHQRKVCIFMQNNCWLSVDTINKVEIKMIRNQYNCKGN